MTTSPSMSFQFLGRRIWIPTAKRSMSRSTSGTKLTTSLPFTDGSVKSCVPSFWAPRIKVVTDNNGPSSSYENDLVCRCVWGDGGYLAEENAGHKSAAVANHDQVRDVGRSLVGGLSETSLMVPAEWT